MRKFLISSCCYVFAIGLAIAMACVVAWFGSYVFGEAFGVLAFRLFVLGSSAWVLIDNKHRHTWRYHAGLPKISPIWLIWIVVGGWTIVFPGYLGLRFRIMMGTASLREEYKPWSMADAQIGPNGLLQPWRGRKL